MRVAVRTSVTVSLLLAGVCAATPALISTPEIRERAVALASVDDPSTTLQDVLQTAAANATAIEQEFAAAPFPALHQLFTNVSDYAENYPGDAATIPTDIADHLHNLALLLDPSAGGALYFLLPGLADYQALYQFAESPVSGVFLGLAEIVENPLLALGNSYQDIVGDLSGATPDTAAAFNAVLDIPANILDALLNGQLVDGTTLQINLSSLATILGPVPAYHTLSGPELQLGGLLSPNGGSLIDALSYGSSYFPPCTGDICTGSGSGVAGEHIGLLGAWETLSQDVAQALGGRGTDPMGAASEVPTAAGGWAAEVNALTTDLLVGLHTGF